MAPIWTNCAQPTATAMPATNGAGKPATQEIAASVITVIASVLLGSALLEQTFSPELLAGTFEANVLSESAAAQRIEFALRGLAPVKEGTP
jgi:hypothetical protein